MEKIDILSLSPETLGQYLAEMGEPKFRAKQLFSWLHQKQEVKDEEHNRHRFDFDRKRNEQKIHLHVRQDHRRRHENSHDRAVTSQNGSIRIPPDERQQQKVSDHAAEQIQADRFMRAENRSRQIAEDIQREHCEKEIPRIIIDQKRGHKPPQLKIPQGARRQCQKAEAERDKAEERVRDAEEALKHQPIVGIVDEEEVDRRAAEKAWGLADARNAELAKDNADMKKQIAALNSKISDAAQSDFENANNIAFFCRRAWDTGKGSYSRLVGEDLETTFASLCETLNSIREEAARLCRQPPEYDGGGEDE